MARSKRFEIINLNHSSGQEMVLTGRAIASKLMDAFALKKPIPPAPFPLLRIGKGEKKFYCSDFERNALKITAFFLFPALGRG